MPTNKFEARCLVDSCRTYGQATHRIHNQMKTEVSDKIHESEGRGGILCCDTTNVEQASAGDKLYVASARIVPYPPTVSMASGRDPLTRACSKSTRDASKTVAREGTVSPNCAQTEQAVLFELINRRYNDSGYDSTGLAVEVGAQNPEEFEPMEKADQHLVDHGAAVCSGIAKAGWIFSSKEQQRPPPPPPRPKLLGKTTDSRDKLGVKLERQPLVNISVAISHIDSHSDGDAEDPLKEKELKERSHVLNAHSKIQMVDEVKKAQRKGAPGTTMISTRSSQHAIWTWMLPFMVVWAPTCQAVSVVGWGSAESGGPIPPVTAAAIVADGSSVRIYVQTNHAVFLQLSSGNFYSWGTNWIYTAFVPPSLLTVANVLSIHANKNSFLAVTDTALPVQKITESRSTTSIAGHFINWGLKYRNRDYSCDIDKGWAGRSTALATLSTSDIVQVVIGPLGGRFGIMTNLIGPNAFFLWGGGSGHGVGDDGASFGPLANHMTADDYLQLTTVGIQSVVLTMFSAVMVTNGGSNLIFALQDPQNVRQLWTKPLADLHNQLIQAGIRSVHATLETVLAVTTNGQPIIWNGYNRNSRDPMLQVTDMANELTIDPIAHVYTNHGTNPFGTSYSYTGEGFVWVTESGRVQSLTPTPYGEASSISAQLQVVGPRSGRTHVVPDLVGNGLEVQTVAMTAGAVAMLTANGTVVAWGYSQVGGKERILEGCGNCGGTCDDGISCADGFVTAKHNIVKLYAAERSFVVMDRDGVWSTWGLTAEGGWTSSNADTLLPTELNGGFPVTFIGDGSASTTAGSDTSYGTATGFESTGRNFFAVICDYGEYPESSYVSGSTRCLEGGTAVDAGYVCSDLNGSSVSPCPAGTYSPFLLCGGECLSCPQGTHSGAASASIQDCMSDLSFVDTLEMSTLTTSASDIFELVVTNDGRSIVRFAPRYITILESNSSTSVQWARVQFHDAEQVIVAGSAVDMEYALRPGESETVFIQFQGAATPGAGEYEAVMTIPIESDMDIGQRSIVFRCTVENFGLVVVGIPQDLSVTLQPGTASSVFLTLFNVFTGSLVWEHQTGQFTNATCSCSPSDMLCALSEVVQVARCNGTLLVGGDSREAITVRAPQQAGVYEYAWPVGIPGMHQFWEVTLVIFVVASPTAFAPALTTFAIQQQHALTAGEAFQLGVVPSDHYGNVINQAGIEGFRASIQYGDHCEDFVIEYDYTAVQYVVTGAVASHQGTATVTAVVNGTDSIPCDHPLEMTVQPVACNPPQTVPDATGATCIIQSCDPGQEPEFDLTACRDCPPGSFSGNGSSCIPCEAGRYCDQLACRSCDLCGGNTYSEDGLRCIACPPGSEPLAERSGCRSCADISQLHVSTTGETCTECQDISYTTDSISCVACPVGQRPSVTGDGCVCSDGYYDSAAGFITCYGPSESFSVRDLNEARPQCSECPPESCVECVDGVRILPGFAVSNDHTNVGHLQGPRHVFQCADMELCTGNLTAPCKEGYDGPLCSYCADGYSRPGLHGTCGKCANPLGVGVIAGAAVASLVAVTVGLWVVSAGHGAGHGILGVIMALFKIAISLVQVVSQLEVAFDFKFPWSFKQYLLYLPSIDLLGYINIGCTTPYTFYGKFIFAFALIPVLLADVLAIYAVRKSVEGIANHCAKMFLMAVFLVYPFCAQSMFQGFSCHRLSETGAYVEADYRISCLSSGYTDVFMPVGKIGIALFPIGVPLVTLFLLLKNTAGIRDGGPARERYLFLVNDYKPGFHFWDTLEMLRKAIITGLLMFFRKGSLLQLFVAITISIGFTSATAWFQPYRDIMPNCFKMGTEMALLFTLILAVLLKVDLADEDISADFVGQMMLVVNVAFPGLSFMAGICGFGFGEGHQPADGGRDDGGAPHEQEMAGFENPVAQDVTPDDIEDMKSEQ